MHTMHSFLILIVSAHALLGICDSQPVMCNITIGKARLAPRLTCDFGYDMRKDQFDLAVKRFNRDTAAIDVLAQCQWKHQGYHCWVANNDKDGENNNNDNYNNNNDHHDEDVDDSSSSNNNNNNIIIIYTNASQLSRYLVLGLPLPLSLRTPNPRTQGEEEDEGEGKEEEEEDCFEYLCLVVGASRQPVACFFPVIEPPSAPTVQQRRTTTSDVEVSWRCGYDGRAPLLGYLLNYTRGGDETWRSERLKPENTSYTAEGLLCGTLYRFVVRAYNYKGKSPESSVLDVWTNGSVPFMSEGSSLVKEINSTTVTLDFIGWKTDGCPIRFFSVKYRRLGDTAWKWVHGNIASDIKEMAVTGLNAGSNYKMVVTAHSDPGNASYPYHFVTRDTPPPHAKKAGHGEEGGHMTSREMGVVIGSVTFVVIASCVALIVGVIRFRRRFRTTTAADNEASLPLNYAIEAESPAGADNSELHQGEREETAPSSMEPASLHVT